MDSPRQTIPAILAWAAQRFGKNPWLFSHKDARWTSESFADVYEKARLFAAWLTRQGLNRMDRVAFVAQGSPAWLAAQLGVIIAGGVAVPLSTRLLPAELRLRLDHCEPRFILCSGPMRDRTAALIEGMAAPGVLICLEKEGCLSAARNSKQDAGPDVMMTNFWTCCDEVKNDFNPNEISGIEAGLHGDDDAFISYTPGTEGTVKAVRITHEGFLSLTAHASRAFSGPRLPRALVAVPADYSCVHPSVISLSMLRGFPLFFSDDPETLINYRPLPLNIRYPHPVFYISEPWVLEKLKKKIQWNVGKRGRLTRAIYRIGVAAGEKYHSDGFNKAPLGVRLKTWLPYYFANRFLFTRIRRSFGCRLRFFVSGSITRKDLTLFHALKIPVFQGYTLTEASSAISCNTVDYHKMGTSGQMLPDVSCRILNRGGYPSGIGEPGEIYVEGPHVMKGYYKNEQATQEALSSGWLATGDMGYVDEDSFLVVTGRKANLLVATDGSRFSPELVEDAILSSSPFFRQALVYAGRGKPPSALVVLDEAHLAGLAEQKHFAVKGDALEAVIDAFFAFTKDAFWRNVIPEPWRPVNFRVLEEGFSAEAGTLNAAGKMVRERIIRSSLPVLESMYSAGEDSPACEANLETVWRLIQKTLGVKV